MPIKITSFHSIDDRLAEEKKIDKICKMRWRPRSIGGIAFLKAETLSNNLPINIETISGHFRTRHTNKKNWIKMDKWKRIWIGA